MCEVGHYSLAPNVSIFVFFLKELILQSWCDVQSRAVLPLKTGLCLHGLAKELLGGGARGTQVTVFAFSPVFPHSGISGLL